MGNHGRQNNIFVDLCGPVVLYKPLKNLPFMCKVIIVSSLIFDCLVEISSVQQKRHVCD